MNSQCDGIIARLPGLSALWAESKGDPRICVAVLDGPVDLSHQAFAGAQLSCTKTLIACAAGKGPAVDHGTYVASILFGQHGSSVCGIAPDCRGIVFPVFSSTEQGSVIASSQLDLARAINQALNHGAQVINISGGEPAITGEADDYLSRAAKLCADNRVLLVAAAGNEGCNCLHIPAALPSVLAVGAMNAQGSPLESSNWGTQYRQQGILAPGEDIPGAATGGDVRLRSGTSTAAPVVSGIVALLLSIQLDQGKTPDPIQVKEALLQSALPCPSSGEIDCQRFLGGRLNIQGALELLQLKTGFRSSTAVPVSRATAAAIRPSSIPEQFNHSKQGGLALVSEETAATLEPGLGSADVMPSASNVMSSSAALSSNSGVTPSCSGPGKPACGCAEGGEKCGCKNGGTNQLVYALGEIGFDYCTEARRDSLIQAGLDNPNDPAALIAHLAANPVQATAVTWILNQDVTPIYAIQPMGAFAANGYELLRNFLNSQVKEGVERVSVPGVIGGQTVLSHGQTVPVIIPELRGMYSWTTAKLVQAIAGSRPRAADDAKKFDEKARDVSNFLERIYYEIRNLGITPQERAMNFAATNAFQIESVFRSAILGGLKLDSITVEHSPICRPGSDCWDVKLTFFNPVRRLEQARTVYRFTVDVSDVVPVTVGKVRNWEVY